VAILRINRPPMLTREVYDAVNAKAGVDTQPPDGLLVHAAGEVDGAFQIVDVWESEEHASRFDTERLTPAIMEVIAGAGPQGSEQAPEPTVYELYKLIVP
jgi:hypothetical protein